VVFIVKSAKSFTKHYFLLDFGDLNKSFLLGNAHASMALHSLNHDFIIHEALVLVLRLVG